MDAETVDITALLAVQDAGVLWSSTSQLQSAGVNIVIWPVSLLRTAMGAAGRALDTLNDEGHLTSKLGEMQHRADLYELIDYESYNHFDSGVFNFTITKE